MPRQSPKQALIDEISEQFRVSGNQENAFDNLAAERLGVNRTDLNCLDLIQRAGPLTAGELASGTGLTTGAVTAVIDRLERVGYARRVRDRDDRRLVMVEVTDAFNDAAGPLWGPMVEDWHAVMRRHTLEELSLLLEFMRAGNEVALRHIERVRDEHDHPPK